MPHSPNHRCVHQRRVINHESRLICLLVNGCRYVRACVCVDASQCFRCCARAGVRGWEAREWQSARRCVARWMCVACELCVYVRERGGGWTGRMTRRPYVPFTHAPLVLKLSASKKYTPKDCINLPVLDWCIWSSALETAVETTWDMYVYFFIRPGTSSWLVTGSSRHNNCFNRWLRVSIHVYNGGQLLAARFRCPCEERECVMCSDVFCCRTFLLYVGTLSLYYLFTYNHVGCLSCNNSKEVVRCKQQHWKVNKKKICQNIFPTWVLLIKYWLI